MILDILDHGDLCSLFTVVLILYLIGSRVSHPTQQRCGSGLAILAFLVYGWYAWETSRPTSSEELLMITVRSLAAGGLTLGLSWMTLPLCLFLHQHLLVPLWRRLRSITRVPTTLVKRFRRRAEERARRQWDEAYERAAPEREQAYRAGEELTRRLAEEQRRREAARADCEFLFGLYEQEIAERFSREQYQEFVTRYLHDRQPAEEVERYAMRLIELMQAHHEKIKPSPKFPSLEALNDWFLERKLQIMETTPPELRSDHLLALENRYDELAKRLIEETNL